MNEREHVVWVSSTCEFPQTPSSVHGEGNAFSPHFSPRTLGALSGPHTFGHAPFDAYDDCIKFTVARKPNAIAQSSIHQTVTSKLACHKSIPRIRSYLFSP